MANVVVGATTKHTASVIFLHGLGDTGHGWSQMLQSIRQPHIKYICPTANAIPVTLNMGMRMPSWFDIRGLSPDSSEDEQGIKAAAEQLESLISEEEKLGVPRNRIIVGGFSQGGAVALYSAFSSPKPPLGGVVAMSSWLPLSKSFPAALKGNQQTPVLQCHGQADSMVAFSFGQMTSQLLQAFNKNVEFKAYPDMDHGSCEEELQEVKQFISKCLPPV
jgi:lysophospholipase-2